MSPAVICAIMFGSMTVLILVGVPLAISMLLCSFVGFTWVSGFGLATTQFTNALFSLSHSYGFAVIPLFMTLGVLASVTGMAEGTFTAAKKWVGGIRGGLLHSVVLANMVFGACSGMSVAGNIVFSRIAMPELKKANYDATLSIGTITSAGSLSVLVPPSVPIIAFCLLAGVSIGDALITGISAAIVFAVLTMGLIALIGLIRRNKFPPRSREKISAWDRIKTLRLLFPILVLFALIVGGSFAGWFPSTIGGAVAVVAILIYAAIKRTPPKVVWRGLMEGVSSFAGVYLIIIAGQFFSRFVTVTGMAAAISDYIASVQIAPFGVFLLVFVFYLFCGCFMDALSIIVITVPVVFPVLMGVGYHELVLVMLLVFSMEIASLTPPVGVGVFYVAQSVKMPVSQVFRGVAPFFALDAAMVMLIALIPDLILWLPHVLGMV